MALESGWFQNIFALGTNVCYKKAIGIQSLFCILHE